MFVYLVWFPVFIFIFIPGLVYTVLCVKLKVLSFHFYFILFLHRHLLAKEEWNFDLYLFLVK